MILNYYEPGSDTVRFNTLSGMLTIKRKGDLYEMDFPTCELKEIPVTDEMERAFGVRPVKAVLGMDLNCVFESEEQVRTCPGGGNCEELDIARAGQTQPEQGIQKQGAEDHAGRKDRAQDETAGKGSVQQEMIRDPAAADVGPGRDRDHQAEEDPDGKSLRKEKELREDPAGEKNRCRQWDAS